MDAVLGPVLVGFMCLVWLGAWLGPLLWKGLLATEALRAAIAARKVVEEAARRVGPPPTKASHRSRRTHIDLRGHT